MARLLDGGGWGAGSLLAPLIPQQEATLYRLMWEEIFLCKDGVCVSVCDSVCVAVCLSLSDSELTEFLSKK